MAGAIVGTDPAGRPLSIGGSVQYRGYYRGDQCACVGTLVSVASGQATIQRSWPDKSTDRGIPLHRVFAWSPKR